MRIILLTPPGRFPTVVHDPGRWYDRLAVTPAHHISRHSSNASWWRNICGAEARTMIPRPSGDEPKIRQSETRVISRSARGAQQTLSNFQSLDVYRSKEAYVTSTSRLADHLTRLNEIQSEFWIALESGPRVRTLDYTSSTALIEYSRTETILSRFIRSALVLCPADIDLLLVSITSPEDLLTSLICVRILRETNPRMHASLLGGGYENFSLRPHSRLLQSSGSLLTTLDTVILAVEDLDEVIMELVGALERGERPRGFWIARHEQNPGVEDKAIEAPPALPIFTPEPILWTRLSKRPCYWRACMFCAQNAKYSLTPSEIPDNLDATLDRIEMLKRAGYNTYIFSDEAISPLLLPRLANGLARRRTSIRWSCRLRFDKNCSRDLFSLMKAAGCYEVLFGLESIAPRILRLMNKYSEPPTRSDIVRIVTDLSDVGVGVHINLILGFPGETLYEAMASVEFLISVLRYIKGATFTINTFTLLPGSPLMTAPETYGVGPIPCSGDIPSQYEYSILGEAQATSEMRMDYISRLQELAFTRLGWSSPFGGSGYQAAVALYFTSGHGAIFKSQPINPFNAS